jgi:hypothetical protein
MGLLQRAVDVGKPGVEVGAKAVDHRNDRTRNTRCNQPVFDGGGAGFVFQEMHKKLGHSKTPVEDGWTCQPAITTGLNELVKCAAEAGREPQAGLN